MCGPQVDFAEFVFDLCRKMILFTLVANRLTCELEQVNRLGHGSENFGVSRNMFFDSFGRFGGVRLVCMSRRFEGFQWRFSAYRSHPIALFKGCNFSKGPAKPGVVPI